MKPERRSYKTYLGDTLEYQESKQIEPAILDDMVSRLREGDKSMIHPIIKGHYRMVSALIADSYSARGRAADIEGAAFLALVEAVTNCCPHVDKDGVHQESRLYDNNITYFITTHVKWAIKEERSQAYVVRVPPRTIRHKIANGENFTDIVVSCETEVGDELNVDSGDDVLARHGFIMPFFVPMAKPEFPSLEFVDALEKATQGAMEQAIIKLRSEGYNYEEIGKKVGYSTPMIGHIVPKIEARFLKLYK